MKKKSTHKEKNARIAVIGAGAGGISVAYFLQKQGYSNVTVLEREGRIGGKCDTITYKSKSFDLGANYITSSYKNVKKIAKEVNAEMFAEKRLRAYNPQTHKFTSLLKSVKEGTNTFTVVKQSIKFFIKRWKLNSVISTKKPGYVGITKYPDLVGSFEDWLNKNGLKNLKTLFQIPISLMGYGKLSEVSAAHALTYMSLGTFRDLLFAAISPKILGYPKRFKEGYARFLERISWKLQVITNAEIHSINRHKDGISIDLSVHEQELNKIKKVDKKMEFDYMIIAAPLTAKSLKIWLTDITPKEIDVFEKVKLNPYILTTYIAENMNKFSAVSYMLPEPKLGDPYVITRQFFDNDLISFYTRQRTLEVHSTTKESDDRKQQIVDKQVEFIQNVGGVIIHNHSSEEVHKSLPYYTYDDFPYFPHFDLNDMEDGYYDKLDSLQGENRTFYVGGLLNFELVETIFNYSKYLVKKHF